MCITSTLLLPINVPCAVDNTGTRWRSAAWVPAESDIACEAAEAHPEDLEDRGRTCRAVDTCEGVVDVAVEVG